MASSSSPALTLSKSTPFPPLQTLSSSNSKTQLKFQKLKLLRIQFHLQTPPQIPNSGLLFRQKLIYLESALNVNSSKALHLNPILRSSPISNLKSVERCLLSMGIEHTALGRIFDMYPQLLTADPYSDLYPVFEFLLNDVGLTYPELRLAVIRCPRLLICDVSELKSTLQFLKRIGFVGSHRVTCQTTVLLVSSVERTLIPKLEFLEGLGLTGREVERMVLRSPGLLTFSIEKNFKPKVDFLSDGMGREVVEEVRAFPQYFSFSLEGRIRPRFKVLMEFGLDMGLAEMLKVSDGEFNAKVLELRLGM